MQNINEIEDLIKLISRLPGLGPKSAKRIVLKLINNRDELVKPMANTLAQVYKNVTRCNSCGSLKSNSTGCSNCENTKEKYSNARDLRRFFEACIQLQSVRLSKKENKTKLDLMMIKKEDIENTINNFS